MPRFQIFAMLFLALGCTLLFAQDDEKLKSGPKAGSLVPEPFDCLNINGPSKGRQSCLVCRFALSPSVLIFTKEPADEKDEAFNELLKQLDEAANDFDYRNFSIGVVVLSADARDSTNNVEVKDTKELIKEAQKRDKLVERLTKRADPLKNVIVGCYPAAGPKKFELNSKAELTILFYDRMRISDNWTFAPEGLKDDDVKAIVKKVRETLPLTKKVEEKK